MVARKIAGNERVLCTAPAYLENRPMPAMPHDLQAHQCIVLRETSSAYGNWQLARGSRRETVKVRGTVSTNDGETALLWALAGFGILQRSTWNVHEHLASGRLMRVLKDWTLPAADVYAVYPERLNLSAKVTAFVDCMAAWFDQEKGWGPMPD